MRNVPLLALVLSTVLAGCSGTTKTVLDRPPAGPYRIPGLAADPNPPSAEPGTQVYRITAGHGVEYEIQAALVRDEVRIITVIENGRRETVRYDLRRASVTGLEGKRLELVAVAEDPSRRPSAADRASEDYVNGLRLIPRGERSVITRRYRLPSLIAAVQASRFLAALELDDELGGAEGVTPVRLRFEKVR